MPQWNWLTVFTVSIFPNCAITGFWTLVSLCNQVTTFIAKKGNIFVLWPCTLTFKLDQHPGEQHAKYLGQGSFHSKVIFQTHTDKQTRMHTRITSLPGPLNWSAMSYHTTNLPQHRNATSNTTVHQTRHVHGSTEASLRVRDHSEQKRLLKLVLAYPET